VDFSPSAIAKEYVGRLEEFMDSYIYPAEETYAAELAQLGERGRPHQLPTVVEELKTEARRRGLWNLFLPDVSGLSNVDYAHLAQITGRSAEIAPEALNCSAPDTGNMEVLHMFGTSEQKRTWLDPLLEGKIRSAFAMTEPGVASSDASNICTEIRRDGDEYVINGRKWWITGAGDPRCKVFVVMGKSDPHAPPHRQQSQILVPRDTPGVRIVRSLPVFGYMHQQGHCEIAFDDVRVPIDNLIGEEGGGFAIAQARLGPGRIHHCMRALGAAERALELMCKRAVSRTAFGGPLSDQGVVRAQIAESRIAIDQARLLTLHTAWTIDKCGTKAARTGISAIKVVAPRVAGEVLDRAIQLHGAAGVSDDFPLAAMWALNRTLRFADGPDEVHVRSVARQELAKYATPERN
jgi:acyl-CoA dehydrogenase